MQSGLRISAESAPFLPIERRVRSRDQPMDPSTAATPAPRLGALVLSLAPGLLLAAAVAFSADRVGGWEASLSQLWLGRPVAIAPPVIALLIGIALHGVASRPQFTPGTSFAIKKVLRWAIALFGLNIAFADIRGLGLASAAMVILTMIATLAAGLLFARLFRLGRARDFLRLARLPRPRDEHRLRGYHHQSDRDLRRRRLSRLVRLCRLRRPHDRNISRRFDP